MEKSKKLCRRASFAAEGGVFVGGRNKNGA
jgi:hypothetical protein